MKEWQDVRMLTPDKVWGLGTTLLEIFIQVAGTLHLDSPVEQWA